MNIDGAAHYENEEDHEKWLLKNALRAVVELEVPTTLSTDASAHTAWLEGYNYRKDQDLEAIEKELG